MERMMKKTSNSRAIGTSPCPACRNTGGDRKGDNLVSYDDGHKYCFKCGHREAGEGTVDVPTAEVRPLKEFEMTGVSGPIRDRKISQQIVEKFGVTLEYDGDVIIKHHYPYFDKDTNQPVASKVRHCKTKQFPSTGSFDNTGLFGQQTCREGGKYITVTEGEIDAMAVSQMFDGKWPVVSLTHGAASAVKNVKENLEWLESFENITICFDNDAAGKKAVQDILPLFSHGKVRIVDLPLKDAGEMLEKGRMKDFISAWWDAKPYRPVDVVSFGDESCWEAFVRRGTEEITPFPEAYGTLNAMMNGGIAAGEVTVIGALTSIGKTTMIYNLLYGMVMESNKKIGAVFLESDKGETVEKIVSLHCGENISLIPANERDNSAYREFYDDFKSNEKVYMLDHLGSSDVDELFSKMRWMVKGMDCDVIILDPLQAAVSSNENKTIDTFMDRCLKLAKETGVSIIIVSHMNKPQAKDAHDVHEYDLKGSGSINQIAFNTILLSRDKMSEDEYTQNCTKVQLVKCRRTGRTGLAGWLHYDMKTSVMSAGSPPEVKAVEDEEF